MFDALICKKKMLYYQKKKKKRIQNKSVFINGPSLLDVWLCEPQNMHKKIYYIKKITRMQTCLYINC